MSKIKTQIGEIAYNPALESFEALVTFHSDLGQVRVAACFDAPLTAEFDEVSDGLLRDALEGVMRSDQLRSRIEAAPARRPVTTLPERRAA